MASASHIAIWWRNAETTIFWPATRARAALTDLPIAGEGHALPAAPENHQADAIRRLEPVDEGGERVANRDRAAESNVLLIDRDEDDAAGRGVEVAGEGLGDCRDAAAAVGRRRQRDPVRRHHAARGAANANLEVGRRQTLNGSAITVDHAHVDRRDVDARLEARPLVLPPCLGGQRQPGQQRDYRRRVVGTGSRNSIHCFTSATCGPFARS